MPLAALLCALFSCSEGLTREEAAEAIVAHYGYPNVDFMRISYGYGHSNRETNGRGTYEISENSDLFEKRGRGLFDSRSGLTGLGERYRVPNKACEAAFGGGKCGITDHPCFCVAENWWEFKEVTGMSTDEAGENATVEYVVVARGVNTFGSYKDKREGMEQTRKATLRKYDDGSWRIEDPKPPYVVKPSDVPFYAGSGNR